MNLFRRAIFSRQLLQGRSRSAVLQARAESFKRAKISLHVQLHEVVVAAVRREVSWPPELLGHRLVQPVAVVERHDVVLLPMQDQRWAAQRLHVPVVGIEVEALPNARGSADVVGVRVDYLDPGKHGGVQNQTKNLALDRDARGRASSDALAVHDYPARRHAGGNQEVVCSLDVRVRATCARAPAGGSIATVLDADDLDAKHFGELEVGTHHHADVRGIAVAVQQHQALALLDAPRAIELTEAVGLRAVFSEGGGPYPDHGQAVALFGRHPVHIGGLGGPPVDLGPAQSV
mmetsp:Transcript_125414/g.401634  ORF Transcript_125414/g.401634 Transcript_125414/m.401634 type:complete len:290 (+) Transcript_125414:305-1174(+)